MRCGGLQQGVLEGSTFRPVSISLALSDKKRPMPQINIVKKYRKNSYYHLYCRGNNRQEIFFETIDYDIFRNIFREKIKKLGQNLTFDSFALLPNHYHFLVRQGNDPRAIEKLMRSCITRYTLFINKKYEKVGRLFQSTYKARIVRKTEIFKMRAYILNNAIESGFVDWKNVGKNL